MTTKTILFEQDTETKKPDEENPFAIMDFGDLHFFKSDREMWYVCHASFLLVGRYENHVRAFAKRIGKAVATVEFYAKAYRVREFVKDESAFCSLHPSGIAPACLILSNVTFTHCGAIHSKVFKSVRTVLGMTYEPIMSPRDALNWLSEVVEPLMDDMKRLTVKELLALMGDSPDTAQWWESWPTLSEAILDFTVKYGEHMPRILRRLLSELIKIDWDKIDLEKDDDAAIEALKGIVK